MGSDGFLADDALDRPVEAVTLRCYECSRPLGGVPSVTHRDCVRTAEPDPEKPWRPPRTLRVDLELPDGYVSR